MNRREFVKGAAVAGVVASLPFMASGETPKISDAVSGAQVVRAMRRYVRAVRRTLPADYFMESWFEFETKSLLVSCGYFDRIEKIIDGETESFTRIFAEAAVFGPESLHTATFDKAHLAQMMAAVDSLKARVFSGGAPFKPEGACMFRRHFVEHASL